MKPENSIRMGHAHRAWGASPPMDDKAPSPFFWWVKALLLAILAVALFPVVFALIVRVGHALLG